MAALPGGLRVHIQHSRPFTLLAVPGCTGLDNSCEASSSVAAANPEAARNRVVAHAPVVAGLAAALALVVGRRGSSHCRQRDTPRGATRVSATTRYQEALLQDADLSEMDMRDWSKELPTHEELEKWEDGEKWILVKDGAHSDWRRDSEVGTYRLTDAGYESRDPSGEWVNYAQMPQDVSHLTDAQRERLVAELRGDIKVSMVDADPSLEEFRPLAKTPPLEQWPFHEVAVTEELKATEEQMKDYRVMQMTSDLGRAFFLSVRWKGLNEARRHLGYNVNDGLEDVANMNGTVLALRSLVEQLKRVDRFRKHGGDQPEPSDAARLRALRATGLLGTSRGSSLALWYLLPSKKRIIVDLCIGDDCMNHGPYAEEMVLRYLGTMAEDLGAETIWCRTRRTESGKVFVPKYMPKLGFTAVPLDQQDEEEWEVTKLFVDKVEAVESVPGLNLWLSTRGLDNHVPAANTWCEEMGAADIMEVADSKEELADYLTENHGLTAEERERLLQY